MAANNLRVVTLWTSSGLDALVDTDGADALPRGDPFSTGLLQAMWSAMFAITESAALWWALSPGRWAEIGDAHFELVRPPDGDDQIAQPGQVKRNGELPFSPLPFTLPSTPSQTTLPSRSDRVFSSDAVAVLPRPAARSPI